MFTATLLAVFVVYASSAARAGQAVVITPPGNCDLFDGNGGFALTNNAQVVATQSSNGNLLLRCQTSVTAPSSGRAVYFGEASTPYVPCVIPLGLGFQVADAWHETVSASGEATVICQVHP